MGRFINHEAASAFLDLIEDPITRALVRSSYTTILLSMDTPEGEFDLEYFFRIMEFYLRDRERLAKALQGNFEDDVRIWGPPD